MIDPFEHTPEELAILKKAKVAYERIQNVSEVRKEAYAIARAMNDAGLVFNGAAFCVVNSKKFLEYFKP